MNNSSPNIPLTELQRMAEELKINRPGMYQILHDHESFDEEEFQRATSGLFGYLERNEESLLGKSLTEIGVVHGQLVKYLLGLI